ncbi:YbhB/YbcL family Raf kinase inhibitor-like protein [Nitrosophilus alvini]|uniref:YbhB/YbcL family Raf kinase inhibitor-like protein n=1 Tax=Nitrosophilus alvini TaxID=2714855 RepID=UPI00190BEC54|nr:YbhB/YbcL family Raf kinase inhibitor-like protein [Nitrosophilus alvini]
MNIFSPAFDNGGFIPTKYTCDGADVSPELIFENIPQSAQSLAIIMDDPDAPMGTFVHWVIYNIPPNLEGLPEDVPKAPYLDMDIRQGVNDFSQIGYKGPCPPGGVHRYFIKLYALDTKMELDPGITKADLLNAMRGHIIGEAVLMGRYAR